MKKTSNKSKKRSARHPFSFYIEGQSKPLSFWVKVKQAKTSVVLPLTEADVENSIKLNGIGSTQKCSMALCAKRNASAFSHPVEGMVEWSYSRAWVVTKTDKFGAPVECVVYRHGDSVARLNDTLGGQRKLLADIKANGTRYINLWPITKTSAGGSGKHTGTGRKLGPRKKPSLGYGAKLRWATAKLNGAVV